MTVPRRAVLAALAALPVATLLPAVTTAQEIRPTRNATTDGSKTSWSNARAMRSIAPTAPRPGRATRQGRPRYRYR